MKKRTQILSALCLSCAVLFAAGSLQAAGVQVGKAYVFFPKADPQEKHDASGYTTAHFDYETGKFLSHGPMINVVLPPRTNVYYHDMRMISYRPINDYRLEHQIAFSTIWKQSKERIAKYQTVTIYSPGAAK